MFKKTAFAFALLGGLLFLLPPAQAASKLVIDQPEFDFGYVPQNSRVSHRFVLQSAGEDSLRIIKVVPGCGCTQTPLKKNDLAAGESTDLEVIFNTGHYTSRVTKRPKIESNAEEKYDDVVFHANVVRRPDSTQPIVIKPYKLDVSQFGEKVRNEIKFTVTNVSDQAVNIKLIDLPEDFFEVSLDGNIAAGQSAEGTLKLRDQAVPMSFEKSFTFECNDADASRFTVPVKRVVQSPEGFTKPLSSNDKKKAN